MSNSHTLHEVARSAPAVAGTGYTVAGLPLAEWAALITIAYVIYQTYSLYRRNKRERELHEKRMRDAEKETD